MGTKNAVPPIKCIDKVKTVQAVDLLNQIDLMGDAKNIVIVGGGVVDCETAYCLDYEYGKKVKVVEMLPNFMEGACTANRGHILHYLEKAEVQLYNCTKVTSFEDGKVKVRI